MNTQYRIALHCHRGDYFTRLSMRQEHAEMDESNASFVKWLTDWIVVDLSENEMNTAPVMTFEDMLNRVDRSGTGFIDFDELCNELNQTEFYCDEDEHTFRQHPIAMWYCTDTRVGYSALYLGDTPLALVGQLARKSSPLYWWISQDCFMEAVKEVQRLSMLHYDLAIKLLSDIHEFEPFDTYTVSFSSQLPTTTVLYQGEECEVITPYRERQHSTSTEVEIKLPNGETKTVSMSEIQIPCNFTK